MYAMHTHPLIFAHHDHFHPHLPRPCVTNRGTRTECPARWDGGKLAMGAGTGIFQSTFLFPRRLFGVDVIVRTIVIVVSALVLVECGEADVAVAVGDCEVVEAEAAWETIVGPALVFPRIIVMVMVVVVVIMMVVVEDGLGSCRRPVLGGVFW